MTGRNGLSARLVASSALLAVLLPLACSSIPRKSDWKGQKKYGALMARKGFWREARFRFEIAAALRPDDSEIQNDLAVSYESVGETSKALTAYKRALELAPAETHIKRNYARFAEYYTSIQRAAAPLASPSATPAPARPPATPPVIAPPKDPSPLPGGSPAPVSTPAPAPGVGSPEPNAPSPRPSSPAIPGSASARTTTPGGGQ